MSEITSISSKKKFKKCVFTMIAFSIPSNSRISDVDPDSMTNQAGNLGSDECQDILKQRYEDDAQRLARPSEAKSVRRRLRFDPFEVLRKKDPSGNAVFYRKGEREWVWFWESSTCFIWNNEKERIEKIDVKSFPSKRRYACWYGPSLNISPKNDRIYIGTLEGVLVLSLGDVENTKTEYVKRMYTRRFPRGVAKSTWNESLNCLAILSGDGKVYTASGPDLSDIVRIRGNDDAFQGVLELDTIMKWEPDGNRLVILTGQGKRLLIVTLKTIKSNKQFSTQRIELNTACLDVSWSGNRCTSRAISCTTKDGTTVMLLDASSSRVRHVTSKVKDDEDDRIFLSGTTLEHPSSMIHINRDISTVFDVVKLGQAEMYVDVGVRSVALSLSLSL